MCIQLDARRVSLKDQSVSLGVRGPVKSACDLREEASCTHFAYLVNLHSSWLGLYSHACHVISCKLVTTYLSNALSFYRSQNSLCSSKLFVTDQKMICIHTVQKLIVIFNKSLRTFDSCLWLSDI